MVSFEPDQMRRQPTVPRLPKSWRRVFQHGEEWTPLSSKRHQASHHSNHTSVDRRLICPREIERLEARVKELEDELHDSRKSKALPTPRSTPTLLHGSPNEHLDPMENHQGNQKQWQGSWITAHLSREVHLFGPTSTPYFLADLRSHIAFSLQLSHSDFHMQPSGASKFLASPTFSRSNSAEDLPTVSEGHLEGESNLSRAQEESFLVLFWQSYYCTIPVLDEVDFREHYGSLWAPRSASSSRKASPLVDIILALCMQYGMTFVPRNDPQQMLLTEFDSEDSTIAGRALYRRCQTLLSARMETPSIMTLQCQIYSAVYLWNASFVNLSHNTLASAIRTAHILGLHQESRGNFSRAQKELHRRLWWVVYTMENNACMSLGRPWLAYMSQVSCALPADDHELALASGPNFASSMEDISWLSYHVRYVELILAARAVHVAFGDKCSQVLMANGQETLHGNAQSLEALAGFLVQRLECLRSWVYSIPSELKTERRDGGKPFSTDRSAVQVDLEAPQWLQRQRLLLELKYHHLMMSLYRPFIVFAKAPSSPIPLSNSHNISCLNHAIASTNIMLQILKNTDILNGWHEAYQYQWDATVAMVGFIFANPVCPPTPTARRTVNKAIEVFDLLRNNFAVAASAASITRDLAVKVDSFLDRFRTGSTSAQQTPAMNPASLLTVNRFQSFDNNNNHSNASGNNGSSYFQIDFDGDSAMSQAMLPGILSESFPMDPFAGAEWSFPEANGVNTEMWSRLSGGE